MNTFVYYVKKEKQVIFTSVESPEEEQLIGTFDKHIPASPFIAHSLLNKAGVVVEGGFTLITRDPT